jgi:FkbM family methyltransferase
LRKIIKHLKFITFTVYTFYKLKVFEFLNLRNFISLHYNKNIPIIFLDRPLFYTSPYWLLHSIQEIFIEKTYNFTNRKNDELYIIDCGSNIGLGPIFWNRLYPNAKILCFEPDPNIFKLLLENTRHIKKDSIKYENKAVWISEKNISFEADGNLGGKISDKTSNQLVETVRLKDVLNQNVDFLKIDIEGAEFDVLKDCQDNLSFVKNIFIEYHSNPLEPQILSNLLRIIADAGFRYYIKEAWVNRQQPYIEKSLNQSVYDLQLNIFGYRINE